METEKMTASETAPAASATEHRKLYLHSFDTLRVICLVLLTFAGLDLPLPHFDLLRPFFNAATGVLFTVYGYVALEDEADLKKHIRHTAKVFCILFAVYLPLAVGFQLLVYGQPFLHFDKWGLFDFAVLNYWEPKMGSSIWYVQSTLYALIGFWVLRRLKKYDWVLCIILFVICVMIGELVGITGIRFLNYNYIPGNFLTRTMPYMLLGRLLRRHYGKLKKLGSAACIAMMVIGVIFSVMEFFGLLYVGKLVYPNHMIGFIPIAAGACLLAARYSNSGRYGRFSIIAKRMYKPYYFLYQPLGVALLLVCGLLSRTQEQYSAYSSTTGLVTALITFCLCYVPAKLYLKKYPEAARDLTGEELEENGKNTGSELTVEIDHPVEAENVSPDVETEEPKQGDMPLIYWEPQRIPRLEDFTSFSAELEKKPEADVPADPLSALSWADFAEEDDDSAGDNAKELDFSQFDSKYMR